MKRFSILARLNNEQGAIFIIVAVSMLVLVGFAALAVDTGHLHVVRNELQNAADAGALAAARVLLNEDGVNINTTLASSTGQAAAKANKSGGEDPECVWNDGDNGPDVIRGHWSFTTGQFTPNDSSTQTDLFNSPDPDTDTIFINAVKVKVHRRSIPPFLARIFGHKKFVRHASAIAYRGFAGNFIENTFDQPIAICADSIKWGGNITCNIGRMLDSSNNPAKSDTGGVDEFHAGAV